MHLHSCINSCREKIREVESNGSLFAFLMFLQRNKKTLLKRKYTAGGFDLIFEEKLLGERRVLSKALKQWEHLR